MNHTAHLYSLPVLLAEAGHAPEQGSRYFLGISGTAHQLPQPSEEPPARLHVHVAGHLAEHGLGGGWAAVVAGVAYRQPLPCEDLRGAGWAATEAGPGQIETLCGPVLVWRGFDPDARTLDRLDALALLAALSGLAEAAPKVPVAVNLFRGPQGIDMGGRLREWRRAGWIGERWTKIPNVDLWQPIDLHAQTLGVSWWPRASERPGVWQEIAAALAEREAL